MPKFRLESSSMSLLYIRTVILAHRIWIPEILPWDRKSYLTHAILPRLSREGYIHWLYWNSRTLWSSDVIVMLKWRHHVKWYLSVNSGTSGSLFLNKKTMTSKKRIHYSCEAWIEKICPSESPFVITRQASWCQTAIPGTDFSMLPYTHDRFL